MYVKLNSNNQIVAYPAFPNVDNPSVSIPFDWDGGTIGDYTYARVRMESKPNANLGWEYVEANPAISENTNLWTQQWETRLLDKAGIKEAIKAKRYDVETAGVTLNGKTYATDRESQGKYTGVVAALATMDANTAASWTIDWQTKDDTFVTLNANDMKIVAFAVFEHVQEAFSKQKELFDLIDTANTTVLANTLFHQGW